MTWKFARGLRRNYLTLDKDDLALGRVAYDAETEGPYKYKEPVDDEEEEDEEEEEEGEAAAPPLEKMAWPTFEIENDDEAKDKMEEEASPGDKATENGSGNKKRKRESDEPNKTRKEEEEKAAKVRATVFRCELDDDIHPSVGLLLLL